jgi:creatinine amidohydrolase/Fe(II)-dependent formamide hydrolase-like protein
MDKAVADGAEERPGPLTRDRANPLGHYAPTGVFGDATLATRQKGQTVVEGMLGDILKEIDALAEAPAPRGTPRSPLDREGVASPP